MKKLMVLAMLVCGMNAVAVSAPDLVRINVDAIPTVISELAKQHTENAIRYALKKALEEAHNLPADAEKYDRLGVLLRLRDANR